MPRWGLCGSLTSLAILTYSRVFEIKTSNRQGSFVNGVADPPAKRRRTIQKFRLFSWEYSCRIANSKGQCLLFVCATLWANGIVRDSEALMLSMRIGFSNVACPFGNFSHKIRTEKPQMMMADERLVPQPPPPQKKKPSGTLTGDIPHLAN